MTTRRIKVEENREARLQRQELRQSQMEELRIAGQKAQKELMMKMSEMFQERKSSNSIYRSGIWTINREWKDTALVWRITVKKSAVGDPTIQHLKFHSKKLAKYQAPAGVLDRSIFHGNVTCEKYRLISRNAQSTLIRTLAMRSLKHCSWWVIMEHSYAW